MSALNGAMLSTRGSLSLFRRGLGVLCLLEFSGRFGSAEFFLSDVGVLPRTLFFGLFGGESFWSLGLLGGALSFVYAFLAFGVLLSLIQVIGRSHRWSRVLLWLLLVSLQNRNPALWDFADGLLRMFLFWDIWLPSRVESDESYQSIAVLGLQMYLTLCFLVSVSYTHLTLPTTPYV